MPPGFSARISMDGLFHSLRRQARHNPPMPEANGDGCGACADRVDSFSDSKDLAGCGNSKYRAPNVTLGGCAGERPSGIHGLGRIHGPLILLVTYEPVAMLFR